MATPVDTKATTPAKHRSAAPSPTDPTVGKLVVDTSRGISELMRKEIALAKTELRVSIKAGTTGIVFFAAAAFMGVLAIIMLSIAFAYLLHWNGDFLDLQWAYLVVFVVYLVIAGVLGLLGLKKVKQVGPPERAIVQGKEIPNALKGKA